jgi:hypothetical protein
MAIPTIIRPKENALAYLASSSLMKKKKFKTLKTSGISVVKLFFIVADE